jgi:hypothetical protein
MYLYESVGAREQGTPVVPRETTGSPGMARHRSRVPNPKIQPPRYRLHTEQRRPSCSVRSKSRLEALAEVSVSLGSLFN